MLGVTGRELEVLRLVADGATNSDVASRLHVSPRTVETHVSSLLAKTGATARAELAVWLPVLPEHPTRLELVWGGGLAPR